MLHIFEKKRFYKYSSQSCDVIAPVELFVTDWTPLWVSKDRVLVESSYDLFKDYDQSDRR